MTVGNDEKSGDDGEKDLDENGKLSSTSQRCWCTYHSLMRMKARDEREAEQAARAAAKKTKDADGLEFLRLRRELNELTARAEKAERERDEAREGEQAALKLVARLAARLEGGSR